MLAYDIAMVVPNRHGELDFCIGWISKGIYGIMHELQCLKTIYIGGVCLHVIETTVGVYPTLWYMGAFPAAPTSRSN